MRHEFRGAAIRCSGPAEPDILVVESCVGMLKNGLVVSEAER